MTKFYDYCLRTCVIVSQVKFIYCKEASVKATFAEAVMTVAALRRALETEDEDFELKSFGCGKKEGNRNASWKD